MKQGGHYLEGANHEVLKQCDHKNLEYFQTSQVQSWQQARWAEILSSYNFVIEHLQGNNNPADGPLTGPDYESFSEYMTAKHVATSATTTVTESYDDLLPEIKAAQETDLVATEIRPTLVDLSTADESKWRSIDRGLTYERRIYVPTVLLNRAIRLLHDNLKSGHFGALNTAELVSQDFYWPATASETRKYFATCELYHQIKAPGHIRCGLNMPLSPSSRPWEGLTMDFIRDLPEETAPGYTRILVIVDRLTKMAIYPPCRKDINSPELAWMFFKHLICKRDLPDNITTNCGNEFTSRFWDTVCSHRSINHCLSTASHLQTDPQTEIQNQAMEQYLRVFGNYKQDNWVELLPLAEFVQTSPSTIPHWWHRSVRTTFTILRCSLSLPRNPVPDHRCR